MSEIYTHLAKNKIGVRVLFDPANKKHLAELQKFHLTGKWTNGCPFYLEEPYLDVVSMMHRKVTDHFISRALKTK